jgi:general secretion pathway protein G
MRNAKGFSMLELVIVVMILAIVAAIAIPRLSRGSDGAADATLAGDLAVLRQAIDHYAAEHGGALPAEANIVAQLTTYTGVLGNPQAGRDATHIYGPYLRKVPPLPVGARKGATGIAAGDAADVGWIYSESTGNIRANTTNEIDSGGRLYKER